MTQRCATFAGYNLVGVTYQNGQKTNRTKTIAKNSDAFCLLAEAEESIRGALERSLSTGRARKWTLEIKDQLRNVIPIGMSKGRRGESK